jgi:hypothetical protein
VFAAVWVISASANMDRRAVQVCARSDSDGHRLPGDVPGRALCRDGEKVLPTWLILTYLLHTFGELCLSPVA